MDRYNPSMLALAREWRQVTQSELASRLSITQGKLSKMESGVLPISDEMASRVSAELACPISFFEQTDQLYGPGVGELYHRKRHSASKKLMQNLYAGINVRRMHVDRLLRGAEAIDCKIFDHDIDEYDGRADEIARMVRAEWTLEYGPIKNVTESIEQAGGIIIPCDFGTRLIDGMSRWVPGLPPLFFINKDLPPDRWRFTLCHELAHLIMHRTPNLNMERQANEFAAEFLMPKDQIRSMLNDVNLPQLIRLKEHWRVAMSALLKRTEDLGKITSRQARYLWMRMSATGMKAHEPFEHLVPVEQTSTLRDLIRVHCTDLGYSIDELCKLLSVELSDLHSLYPFAVGDAPKSHLSLLKS